MTRLVLAVSAACGLKLAIMIPIWAQKASKTSFLDFLAFANTMLTDAMLFFFAAYALIHYLRGYNLCSHQRKRMDASSTTSTISGLSAGNIRSIRSTRSDSGGSRSSRTSIPSTTTSIASTTASIVDHRTRISIPMSTFLRGQDDYFGTARGMVEGNFGEFGGAQFTDTTLDHGVPQSLLE
ncbi:hypothetical protein TWF730_004542 [Orbilia blumenaviensis]|uniref:Uncharacterized protein n=1 Tax=Orbilia blumenaviensis TaxID=1796055 RepID=A0AAV9TYR6_9PEZI